MPFAFVVHHADRVAAFGHLVAVFVKNHRQVAIHRQRRAQRFQDIDLARVLLTWSSPRMTWVMFMSQSSTTTQKL